MIHCNNESPLVNFILAVITSFGVVVGVLMPKWFGYSKKEESYADSGTKNHGEVRDITEFWFSVLGTKLNVAKSEG